MKITIYGLTSWAVNKHCKGDKFNFKFLKKFSVRCQTVIFSIHSWTNVVLTRSIHRTLLNWSINGPTNLLIKNGRTYLRNSLLIQKNWLTYKRSSLSKSKHLVFDFFIRDRSNVTLRKYCQSCQKKLKMLLFCL